MFKKFFIEANFMDDIGSERIRQRDRRKGWDKTYMDGSDLKAPNSGSIWEPDVSTTTFDEFIESSNKIKVKKQTKNKLYFSYNGVDFIAKHRKSNDIALHVINKYTKDERGSLLDKYGDILYLTYVADMAYDANHFYKTFDTAMKTLKKLKIRYKMKGKKISLNEMDVEKRYGESKDPENSIIPLLMYSFDKRSGGGGEMDIGVFYGILCYDVNPKYLDGCIERGYHGDY
jgi:hypothetical protein